MADSTLSALTAGTPAPADLTYLVQGGASKKATVEDLRSSTVYELTGTAIDPANGEMQFKTLAANTTFTEALTTGQGVTLELYASTFTITWPTTYWLNTTSSTTAPILNTSGPTIVELWKRGTTLYGSKVA